MKSLARIFDEPTRGEQATGMYRTRRPVQSIASVIVVVNENPDGRSWMNCMSVDRRITRSPELRSGIAASTEIAGERTQEHLRRTTNHRDADVGHGPAANDHVLGMGQLHQAGNEFGRIRAVGVGDGDVLRSRRRDAGLECRPVTAIFLQPNHTGAMTLRLQRRLVSGAIVDDNDVEGEGRVGKGGAHPAHDRANSFSLVIRRYHNGDINDWDWMRRGRVLRPIAMREATLECGAAQNAPTLSPVSATGCKTVVGLQSAFPSRVAHAHRPIARSGLEDGYQRVDVWGLKWRSFPEGYAASAEKRPRFGRQFARVLQ